MGWVISSRLPRPVRTALLWLLLGYPLQGLVDDACWSPCCGVGVLSSWDGVPSLVVEVVHRFVLFLCQVCVWCLCSWVVLVAWFAVVLAPLAAIVRACRGPCWHTSPSPVDGVGRRGRRLLSCDVIALCRPCGQRDLACLAMVVWMVCVVALFCRAFWAMWAVSVVPLVAVVAQCPAATFCFLMSGVMVVVFCVLSVLSRLGCPLVVGCVVRGHRGVARVVVVVGLPVVYR